MSRKREDYFNNKSAEAEVINAYVTFRNKEARDLALKTYNVSCPKRVCLEYLCCIGDIKKRKIMGKGYPTFVESPKPEIINWENL